VCAVLHTALPVSSDLKEAWSDPRNRFLNYWDSSYFGI